MGDTPLEIPQSELVIYEMHVRGFTRHLSSGVRFPGTFAGLYDKIPYLKELGVNCVELMPIFEFDEFENYREIDGRKLYNYWGYSTVNFFAPKAGYAAAAPIGLSADELKNIIMVLHKNGIEVILDVVFNRRGQRERSVYLLPRDRQPHLLSADSRRELLQFQRLRKHDELQQRRCKRLHYRLPQILGFGLSYRRIQIRPCIYPDKRRNGRTDDDAAADRITCKRCRSRALQADSGSMGRRRALSGRLVPVMAALV